MLKSLILVFTLLSFKLHAIDIGTSMTNTMQGRIIPSLHLGYDQGTRHISFHSSGVQTELYYHNTYALSYYLQENWGKLFFGDLIAGPGIGAYYAKLSYREDKNSKDETGEDFVFGPGLRAEFIITPNLFIGLETIMGIGGAQIIALSFQDISFLTFGWRF